MDRITSPVTAAVALGSNLGDRAAHLNYAIARLGQTLGRMRTSHAIDTAPVDVAEPQPRFLNAVAVGQTNLAAHELLDVLLTIEQERGRERPHPRAARTLDLDLILFGDAVLDDNGLVLPHPRFRERRFVLAPLADIAPEMKDPVTGATVAELLERLNAYRG